MRNLFLVFLLLPSIACAQDVPGKGNLLSEKYFHFRQRLVADFTLGIGEGFGKSMPASVRKTFDRNYAWEHTISWGDGTIDLAYYIGVLATEYTLLAKQNLPVEQTLQELYYAMEAFNRLDYFAEEYYGAAPSLNGFFVRSDVGRNLFTGKNKNENYAVELKRLNSSSNDSLNNIESEWIGFYQQNNVKRFAVSKDQVFHLLVAMRLVTKCLPGDVTFQNKKFRDGEIAFAAEAKKIAVRMMEWIHPAGKSNFITNWRVRLPNGKKTGAGYNAWTYGYGMSMALENISDIKNPRSKGFSWWLAKSVYNITWVLFKPVYFFNQSEGLKTLSLATISNNGKIKADKLYRYSFFSEKYPNYHIPLLYGFLYGKLPAKTDLDFYKKLFDEAPLKGPSNRRTEKFTNYNWSSTSLMLHPERRGEEQPHFPGDYNAIDYMFMYNLYLLCSGKNY